MIPKSLSLFSSICTNTHTHNLSLQNEPSFDGEVLLLPQKLLVELLRVRATDTLVFGRFLIAS